jgi:aspartyl-tRNA(Asn)/glutamyl-tRNA(Gln) amidotransferase subunit C
MKIDASLLQRIARLSMIGLTEDEAPAARADLERILDMVEDLQAVDTRAVTPLAHPLDLAQRLRPDEVTEENQRDQLQAVAPLVRDGLYLVPRVLE